MQPYLDRRGRRAVEGGVGAHGHVQVRGGGPAAARHVDVGRGPAAQRGRRAAQLDRVAAALLAVPVVAVEVVVVVRGQWRRRGRERVGERGRRVAGVAAGLLLTLLLLLLQQRVAVEGVRRPGALQADRRARRASGAIGGVRVLRVAGAVHHHVEVAPAGSLRGLPAGMRSARVRPMQPADTLEAVRKLRHTL